jgi:DNA-binding FadR family transcriptional regulator
MRNEAPAPHQWQLAREAQDGRSAARSSRKDGLASSPETPPPDQRKLAEIVAYEIEQQIVAQGWPVGILLGSEPELIERFGVSRAVLRESVRILENHTTARMRRGPGGGLIVTEPLTTALIRPVALYLEYCRVTPEQIIETGTILELAGVELAAERINEEGILTLRECLEVERKASMEGLPSMARIHVTIAELSGNPVLPLFVKMLTELEDARMKRHREGSAAVVSMVGHDAHAAIVDAVVRGDGALARHRMSRHLSDLSSSVL